jgi:hypothetical protein
MKKLLFTLILVMCFGISQAQIKMMFDTEKSEKEKIESFMSSGYSKIVVTRIDTDEIDWQQDSAKIISIDVDKDNNIYTETNYSPQYSKTIIKLDNKINSREIFNSNDQSQGKTLYFYDSKGNLEKRELYFGDLKAFDEIYEYDNGKLIKMKYVMSDGTLVSYSTFNFDGSDNLLEEIKYNSSGEVEYKYEYSYNKKSQLSEERIIMGKDNTTIVAYSYNKDGKLTDKVTTSKGIQTSINRYSFQDGNLSEEVYDSPGLKVKKTYSYKDGLLTQIKFLDTIEMNSYIWIYEYIK